MAALVRSNVLRRPAGDRVRRAVESAVKKRAHPEDVIQRAVCDHLRSRAWPDVFWFHVPNGAKLGGKRNAKGFPIQAARLKGLGVRAGVPDLILIRDGKTYGLELKAPGGRTTPSQEEVHIRMISAGAGNVYVRVAYGIDAAIRELERWGLLRGHTEFAEAG